MPAVFQKTVEQDLHKPLKIQYCADTVFTKDNAGNQINVLLFEDGEPYSSGGTVSATAIRADGATESWAGTISGNTVSVALTRAALDVPGTLQVFIKVTAGTTETTVYAGVYNVVCTETPTVVAPVTPSDVAALIASIEAAIRNIPADWTSFLGTIAPTFDPSKEGGYAAGAYVWYPGQPDNVGTLYRFTSSHSGTWTGTDVVTVVVGNELNDTVRYTQQIKTDAEKTVARANIGAASNDGLYNLAYQVSANTTDIDVIQRTIGSGLDPNNTVKSQLDGIKADIGTVPDGQNLQGEVSDLKSALKNTELNLFTGIAIRGRFIDSSGAWNTSSNFGESAPISVNEGDFVYVYGSREIPAVNSIVCAFLSDSNLDPTSTSNIVKIFVVSVDMLKNGWYAVQIPSGVKYFVTAIRLSNEQRVIINKFGNVGKGRMIPDLEEPYNLFNDYIAGSYISYNGTWKTQAAYGQIKPVPVSEGEVICVYGIFGSNLQLATTYAFLSSDELNVGSLDNVVEIGRTDNNHPDEGYINGWFYCVVPHGVTHFTCAVVISRMSDVIINKCGFLTEIEKTSIYGKRISIYGDSISTYAGYIPSGNRTYYGTGGNGVDILSTAKQTWWMETIDRLGLKLLVNNSWSARIVSNIRDDDTNFGHNVSAGYKQSNIDMLADNGINPECIIIKLGINDFGYNCPLGTYDGSTVLPTTASTFLDAYAIMLDRIMTTYPKAIVYCCTLMACERIGATGFPEVNRNGDSISDFNDGIRKLANAFGAKVIEHGNCGITYYNLADYMGDYAQTTGAGLHPNADGMKLIANSTVSRLVYDYQNAISV